MTEPEVRYCTSEDGTSIAYCVEGDGPALVECPGSWESFADGWEDLAVYGALRRGRTSVRYDFRGCGLSQRDAPSYVLDSMSADLDAVIGSAGLTRFALWASTLSVGPALLYAANHPDKVARLILTRVMTRGPDVMPRENLDALVALVHTNWEMAAQVFGDMGTRSVDPLAGVRIARTFAETTDPDAVAKMLTDLYETVDVHGILPDIRCPTLILHRKEETVMPFAAAQHAAAVIPDARLVPLPGSGPTSTGQDAEEVIQTMAAFLDEDSEIRALPSSAAAPVETGSPFRTVLFTDVVGHTEMMRRLGDERGRDILREHERITREALTEYSGDEIKTMGDGFMASFGSVTRAMDCAIAIQQAFAEHNTSSSEPLQVRVGLNAGEPIEEDGDLFGSTVIMASRIAAKAGAGEILIPEPLRHLLTGKSYVYADRGETMLKGFEDAVRLFEVRWRDEL